MIRFAKGTIVSRKETPNERLGEVVEEFSFCNGELVVRDSEGIRHRCKPHEVVKFVSASDVELPVDDDLPIDVDRDPNAPTVIEDVEQGVMEEEDEPETVLDLASEYVGDSKIKVGKEPSVSKSAKSGKKSPLKTTSGDM